MLRITRTYMAIIGLAFMLGMGLMAQIAQAADLERFAGNYKGSAMVELYDGSEAKRDLSVSIKPNSEGFRLEWSTITYRDSGAKEKRYVINFVDSAREGVFAAAMKRNVFGHEVPLAPMKGKPYLGARIKDDTLSVYSLFVNSDGSYELQQYDRTLMDGGLQLEFTRLHNGEPLRSISIFLERE
ncbi:MAG: hypothetical protein AB3N11_11050 [Arenibacterium sp.]